jgi:hypothetical protein
VKGAEMATARGSEGAAMDESEAMMVFVVDGFLSER